MASLVYHTGALGDFMTTIPALLYWKNQNSNEKIVLLGMPPIGAFAKETSVIDDYLDVNSSGFLPLFSDIFSSETIALLAPYRTALLFTNPDSPIIKNVQRCGILSLYWQPPFPATNNRLHITDYHLSLFADPESLDPEEKQPHIVPSPASMQKSFSVMPENCFPIALHPGSGSSKKNWPFERYLSLADSIRKKGMPVLWMLGPGDEAFNVPSNDLIVSNQPLSLCAALLSRCHAFIGNDSGVAHLAAGVGCPTLALFGPSDPQVWAPQGENVRIIYKNKPCSPCHQSPAAAPECDRSCLNAITVEEVFNVILNFRHSGSKQGPSGLWLTDRKGNEANSA